LGKDRGEIAALAKSAGSKLKDTLGTAAKEFAKGAAERSIKAGTNILADAAEKKLSNVLKGGPAAEAKQTRKLKAVMKTAAKRKAAEEPVEMVGEGKKLKRKSIPIKQILNML
jgi:hypothetical protein